MRMGVNVRVVVSKTGLDERRYADDIVRVVRLRVDHVKDGCMLTDIVKNEGVKSGGDVNLANAPR